ncbi:GTA baseplate fiber-binding domain-containing protein [Sphingomonas adhaesiva]|uniref:GTA baseplate fiber-binding domain-containing protein n=1 Tax=Sphingomonas adhaesiva TaxID=28212 RepID=UPI002FF7C57A
MATLVLTAVGTAIGGPIGAALGAAIGQTVDRAFLSPGGGRQGPRLSDLRVQTSSYGAPIAKVFGTMRVAGCVIWSTDLIETRGQAGGGKGQPSVTTYSYAASFAVALSARPIQGVGRIWADGKLLRGAAGDWKSATGYRLHRGGEDQPPDPLIASLEAAAPAHRGIAYAVFENLQLADFGNRIPSLTFEVVADEVAPSIGDVARALAPEVIAGPGPTQPVPGFAATGDSAAAALSTLASLGGAWLVPEGRSMRIADRLPAATMLDADTDVAESRRPIETVPRTLALSYYDPARDYQIGVQQARRGGGGWREETVALPMVLSATAARGAVEAALRRAERDRVTRRVTLDATSIGVAPGAAVRLPAVPGVWRVTRASVEAFRVTLDLSPGERDAPAAVVADPGRGAAAPDVVIGATNLIAVELPGLDERLAAEASLTVFAAGGDAGWRQASVLFSRDAGASWEAVGTTAAPAVMGALANDMPLVPGVLEDRVSAMEVALLHDAMTLQSATPAARDRGANLALVGDELIQFGEAVQVAPCRWRLSRLWRARRGTPAAAHGAGARFVLVERDAMLTIPLAGAVAGSAVQVLASGVGDVAGPVAASATVTGMSIAPPSPVRLRGVRQADGTAMLSWTRRSRSGWYWRDGGDAPLGEEAERYLVTIEEGDGARRFVTGIPRLTVAIGGGPAVVSVRQQGTVAASAAATLTI